MFPKICTIGPFTVYSYGVMFALAVMICSFLIQRDARRRGMNGEALVDLTFWVIVSGIIGARIFYVFLNLEFFSTHPAEIMMVQNGGLAWQGGFFGGALAGYIFLRKKKLPLLKTLDLTAPYIALGESIGRIGCFLNGCCYGKEAAWGIYFPVHHAHLHPTQLYATASLLVVFFILKKFQDVSKIPGDVFAVYLVLAGLQRFVNEFFRGDHDVTVMGLSVFQWVSLCIISIGIGLHFVLKKRKVV